MICSASVALEVHAVRADLAEQVEDLADADPLARRLAEWVAADVADGPEAERELQLGIGGVIRHVIPSWMNRTKKYSCHRWGTDAHR
jgi:hypothetical protein